MPKVALTSIVPSRGKIVDITAVGITLNNFPAPLAAFDIVISVNKIEARVVAFARADASLDARAVQTMIVYAEMPCCSDDIVAGKVEVWAYHRSFPRDASPPAALFEYYNPDMPSVIKVEGDTQGPSAQGNNVKMSMMTLVRLTLLNVPLSVTRVDQIKATVPGVTASAALVTVPIKFLSVQTSGQADVRLQLPASQSSGVSVVTLNFPLDLTTTFEVRYYNDLQPVITSVDPTVGKWTGGSTLRISVANFPVMTSPDQATVKFGLEGASFGTIVSILKSSGLETQLIVLTPAYFGALQAGTVEVQVGVTSVQNSNKAAVNGRFSFEKLAPSLESVSISKGSSFGGDQLRINLKNFPAGTTASAVVVEFDTSFVDASQITIPLSNTDRTQVVVTTPPFDPPSTVYCRVYLRASGRGSSDRLKFSYTFIDTRLPSMQLPVPRFACIGRPSVSKTFFVLLFADLSKPANYTHPTPIVTYAPTEGTATPWTVTSYQASTREAAAMVVASTATSVAASSSGEITMLAGSKSVSFAFELRDCAQVALVSASPRKGVSLGGGDVQVRIANMPINEQLANGGITASFGSTSGQVVTAQKVVPDPTIYPDAPTNEWDVYLTITSPAIDMIGSVTVTLKTGSAQVTFEYAIVEPCDLKVFCASQQLALGGMVLNPFHLETTPPIDETCSFEYCITKDAIPFPTIQRTNVCANNKCTSKPIGVTTGGDLVTLTLLDFVAQSAADVSISVSMGQETGFCTINEYAATGWTAPPLDALSNQATLTFVMPPAPLGKGAATVVITATFGSEKRVVSFSYEYIKPIVGRAQVLLLSPSSVRTGEVTQMYVELRYEREKEVSCLVKALSCLALSCHGVLPCRVMSCNRSLFTLRGPF